MALFTDVIRVAAPGKLLICLMLTADTAKMTMWFISALFLLGGHEESLPF